MSRVIHFELDAYEPERAIKFYADVFGWKAHKWDGPMDYWILKTGSADEPGIDGGMTKKEAGTPLATVNTIHVLSVEEVSAMVAENGGKVIAPKMAIPGIGYLAYCQDTEGNTFGIIENDAKAQ